jgi:hypothetical protein
MRLGRNRPKVRAMWTVDPHDFPAWVQAVGSLLAIAIAVAVDQGAARRAREERRASLTAMRADRVAVIEMCGATLMDIADAFAGVAIDGAPVGLDGGSKRQVAVTTKAIDYYVANAGEVGPELVGVLIHAKEVMADGAATLKEHPIYSSREALDIMAGEFRARAADIEKALHNLQNPPPHAASSWHAPKPPWLMRLIRRRPIQKA